MAADPQRVIVVGAGAFGRNHLRVYRDLEQSGHPVQLVAVVDSDPNAAGSAATAFEIPAFATVEECLSVLSDVSATSVCTPTGQHTSASELLLSAGIDVLIEKPIAGTLREADRILSVSTTNGRLVQVGHLERFNPAVIAVRPLLNRPMFFEAHRLSVFTPRSLDVDVVLDLMIHDLDIVLSLVTSPVREVRAVGLPILSRKADIANARIEFENGCVANFTASRVSTERVRKLRFFQPHQYLSLDFARQDVLMIDVAGAAAMDRAQMEALAALAHTTGTHPSSGLMLRKVEVEPGEPLKLEILSFLESVRTRSRPVVNGEDGRAALEVALQVNEAIAAHAERTGL